uniref:Phospholipid scramblase n=1 Tax=Plectus sambesii TaxID=2011161 RepID=A0A914UJH0_9BILA
MAYPGHGNIVTQQPMPGVQGAWAGGVDIRMTGLEYLSVVDRLVVKQQTEMLEVFTGYETGNKYEILNSLGQRVFYAAEDACCCGLCLCCQKPCKCWKNCKKICCMCCEREFDITVFNNAGKPKVEVEGPPGNPIGTVVQNWSICKPQFSIQDVHDETVLKIEGPCITCSPCGNVEFQLLSKNGEQEVGKVSKNFSGFAQEMFTDADNYGITFPINLPVNEKATVLAACFLIDFMFFEDESGKDGDAPGMCD